MPDDEPVYNRPDEPVTKTETSIYGWTNERDHDKVLVYVPASIRRHEEFPLEKGEDVTIRIDAKHGELVISSTD
jgi:hypothetical protein